MGGGEMDARIYRLGNRKPNCDALLENPENAKRVFRLLANENRLKILCFLLEEEKSVGQIIDFTELKQATVSQQLALLRAGGLVDSRRDGKAKYYKLKHSETRLVLESISDVFELGI